MLTRMVTTWPTTARPPAGGLVPTSEPAGLAASTRTVCGTNPASASAARHRPTEPQPGTGRVLPLTTTGSAGGNSPLPRASRIGAIAARQIVAGLLPPKPPTSWFCLGLSTITLAVISGVEPTKAAEKLSCDVPVLPAIWCPAT